MSPQRIQLRRTKGWRKPEGAVVVARPSRWGNPFVVGQEAFVRLSGCQDGVAGQYNADDPRWFDIVHAATLSAEDAVRLYRDELVGSLEDWHPDNDELRDALAALAGKDLACWCPLDKPCHADVLLELANTPDPSTVTRKDQPTQ